MPGCACMAWWAGLLLLCIAPVVSAQLNKINILMPEQVLVFTFIGSSVVALKSPTYSDACISLSTGNSHCYTRF